MPSSPLCSTVSYFKSKLSWKMLKAFSLFLFSNPDCTADAITFSLVMGPWNMHDLDGEGSKNIKFLFRFVKIFKIFSKNTIFSSPKNKSFRVLKKIWGGVGYTINPRFPKLKYALDIVRQIKVDISSINIFIATCLWRHRSVNQPVFLSTSFFQLFLFNLFLFFLSFISICIKLLFQLFLFFHYFSSTSFFDPIELVSHTWLINESAENFSSFVFT